MRRLMPASPAPRTRSPAAADGTGPRDRSPWRRLRAFVGLILAFVAFAATVEAAEAGSRTIRFTLDPGDSYDFTLPYVDLPVRVDVAMSADGPEGATSMLMTALLTQSSRSLEMSWLASDSDARPTFGNTRWGNREIARIIGPDGRRPYAVMSTGPRRLGGIRIAQPATNRATGHYFVTLSY